MKTETTIKGLEKAIEHFNAVADVNGIIAEYHTKTGSINKLIDAINKNTKYTGTVIFSAPLKIVLKSAGFQKNLISDLKLNKIEIRYYLNKDRDDVSYGFRLDMTLLSNDEYYSRSILNSFTIAISKDYNIYCTVCEEKKLKIRDSEARYVQFSTEKDFYEVINLCEQIIGEFNEHVEGQESLLLHMAVQ